MHIRKQALRARRRVPRRGIAAVEAAVVLPLMVALILGAIDLGQYANCHQKVSDACREAARYAAQYETADTSAVESLALTCLGDMFPEVSALTLQSNTTVIVRNATDVPVTGTELGSIGTGNPVSVEVTLQFGAVRWISGPEILCGRTVQSKTVMRRE